MKNIVQELIIIARDTTGGSKYNIYGSLAYLKYISDDTTSGCILVAACIKVAIESLTIIVKELKGLKSGTELAKKVLIKWNISKNDTHYYAYNAVVLHQIEAYRQDCVVSMTRGVRNLYQGNIMLSSKKVRIKCEREPSNNHLVKVKNKNNYDAECIHLSDIKEEKESANEKRMIKIKIKLLM